MGSFARMWITTGVIALSGIGLTAACNARLAIQPADHPRVAAAKKAKAVEVYATYYGWFDNTPPGCATAYSGCARGTGTYQHPITFASDKHEFPVGTILYYPTIEKYLRMDDDCQECDADWSGDGPDGGPHLHHVDIWIGGKGGNESDVINCEDALTQGLPDGGPQLTPFMANPPSDMPVSTEPLFNSRTNHCYRAATTSTSHGRYMNVKSRMCLEDPGYSPKSGTPAELGPCNTGAAEKIAFDGAFLVAHRLCLQTQTGKPGAAITFTTCDGNDRQQWEINPDGTITWIQYLRCIADVFGKVELVRCTNTAADRWYFTSEGP